jgi:isocitrate/isopropylmalate dehydrogenase
MLVVNQKGKQAMTSPYRIAVIPADGIGTEVMPEGLRVLETVGRAFDIDFVFEHFDYACADSYTPHTDKCCPTIGLTSCGSSTASSLEP